MRVLVCDDEEDLRLLYRTAFELEGAEVVDADDGDTGVDVARRWQPDLIVLDLQMPRMGGLSALPLIRAACPGASVIIVTAHGTLDMFRLGRELGAAACFDKLDFLNRVPRLMQRGAA
ncbi:MAG: response regulator [Acidimicrobiales bacterium]